MDAEGSLLERNARIVAIAGIVAGVVGGLTGRLLQRQREPTARERLRSALDELPRRDGGSVASLLRDLSETARHDVEESVQRAKRGRKDAGKHARAARESGESLAEQLGASLREGTRHAGESLREVFDETTQTLGHVAEEAGATTSKASKKRRKDLEKQARQSLETLDSRAREGREELMKLGKSTRSKSEDRLHEIEELAREMLRERVKPSLEKAGAVAAAGASEARKRLEDEAKHLGERYEEARPKLEEVAEHYTERASEVTDELLHAAGERAHEAERLLQEGGKQARQLAHDAGESAKEGTRDAGSLLLWVGIAAGLVYLVFLNDEQKRKARELAQAAWHEGMAIYKDVRGENGDFTSAERSA